VNGVALQINFSLAFAGVGKIIRASHRVNIPDIGKANPHEREVVDAMEPTVLALILIPSVIFSPSVARLSHWSRDFYAYKTYFTQ
jgi:hypothetical protein